jgi:hypothetical protein
MRKISKCPACGANAYLIKDVVDECYFGYSIGCTRYRLNDNLHNVNMAFSNIDTESKAIEKMGKLGETTCKEQ